jgi:hypothetical protein
MSMPREDGNYTVEEQHPPRAMSTTIVADLVKALEESRHEGYEELHPDLGDDPELDTGRSFAYRLGRKAAVLICIVSIAMIMHALSRNVHAAIIRVPLFPNEPYSITEITVAKFSKSGSPNPSE